MHDSVATFYGGYDQVGMVRGERWRTPWLRVAIVFAVIALILVIAADVAAFESPPTVVRVTSVEWYEGPIPLVTGPGFTVHPSQIVVLAISCAAICFPFHGVNVSAPFVLVSFTTTLPPIQNATVTVRAPATAYSGPLTITLGFTLD